jgi:hypothetical protein
MANVKVFADRQTDRWTGQKLYAPDLSIRGHKNNLRSNNYEVCTAVALCFPNILDVMVLENINLSSDRNYYCGRMIQIWISVICQLYTLSAVFISTVR